MSKKKILTLEQIFEAESSYNEGRNYHDLCGMTENIFSGIKKFLDEKDYIKVASEIATCVCDGDSSWTKYVYDEEEENEE